MEDLLSDKLGSHGVGVKDKDGMKHEVLVRRGWQLASRAVGLRKKMSRSGVVKDVMEFEGNGKQSADNRFSWEDQVSASTARLMEASRQDVKALWEHPTIRGLVKRRKLRLEDSSSFFLDDLDRIASLYYVPSDNDILRARVRTMGVSESVFDIQVGPLSVVQWRLYDVGGARGQRQTWVPFFEDANAIIFLAPISAFDQYLEEDQRTNRVDDSLQLFTSICANPLLKSAHLVLFLNKVDVLQKKLAMGVKVRRYITSYGDRPNAVAPVTQYFRAHFGRVFYRCEEKEPRGRQLYAHLTSVVDTLATQTIISSVRTAIFQDHLRDSALI